MNFYKTVSFATFKRVLADDKGTSWTDMETSAKQQTHEGSL